MASSHALFSINVGLTEEGVEKWEEVVETVYSYIGMMRKIGGQDGASFPSHIYSEIKAVGDFKFRFQEDEEPSELVEDLADELSPCHAYPPEHILDGSTLAFEYDGRAVMEILNKYMTCNNMRIDIISSSYGRDSDYEEGEGGEDDTMEVDDGEEEKGKGGSSNTNPTPRPPPPPLNCPTTCASPINSSSRSLGQSTGGPNFRQRLSQGSKTPAFHPACTCLNPTLTFLRASI